MPSQAISLYYATMLRSLTPRITLINDSLELRLADGLVEKPLAPFLDGHIYVNMERNVSIDTISLVVEFRLRPGLPLPNKRVHVAQLITGLVDTIYSFTPADSGS
jgi:hypothetical protein